MSDPTPSDETPKESNKPESGEAVAKPAPAISKTRRWLKRLKFAAITFLVGGFILRVIMMFALPTVLSKVASFYGFELKCDRQSLALFGGRAGLWGVKIIPKGRTEPILTADYIHGEINPFQLLRGRLYVLRAEADGVDLVIQRTADGKIPILEQLASKQSPQTTTTPTGIQSIDFTSPLRVEALRLNKIDAHLRDNAVEPKLDAEFKMDVRVNHIGETAATPVSFEIDAWADNLLDSVRINGQATAYGRNLDAKASLFLRGLHPIPLGGYLIQFGLKPVAESIGGEANLVIKATPAPDPSKGITASVAIDGIRFTADQSNFATLGTIHIDASDVDPTSAKISSVVIEGGKFVASRSTHGVIQVAGCELVPAPPAAPSSPMRYAISVNEVKLHDLGATFQDNFITPPATLGATIADLTATPKGDNGSLDIDGTIAAPGVARSVTIGGSVQVFAPAKSADLKFSVEGIRPDALKPYLKSLGIESELKDATFAGSARIDASLNSAGDLSAAAKITSIKFTDGRDLLLMNDVNLAGLGIDGKTGRLRIDSIDLAGPSIEVTRDRDGSIASTGFRIRPNSAVASSASVAPIAEATSTTQPATSTLPRIEIGRLSWKGVTLSLTDLATPGTEPVTIDDAGIEIHDLILDLSDNAGEPKNGTIHAWLKSPHLAGDGLSVEGTLMPGNRSLSADLKVRGEKLNTTPLTEYLKPFGIEPLLTDGSAKLDAKANLVDDGNGVVTASIDLTNAAITNAGVELAGVDQFMVDSVSLKSNELAIGQVTIKHPRASVLREADGAIVAGGARVRFAALTTPPDAKPTPPATRPTTAPATTPLESFIATLKSLRVEDGELHVTDQAVTPNLDTTAHLTAEVVDVTLGRSGPPGAFDVKLACDGILDELTAKGTLNASPGAESAKIDVAASGIRPAALDAYLPPNIRTSLKDGRLKATIEASSATNPAGGRGATLAFANVDWRDGEATSLFSLDSATIAASRIDLTGDVIAVDEVSLNGLQTQAWIGADGAPRLLGITMVEAPPAAPTTAPTTAPVAAITTQPTTVVENADEVARLVAEARRPLPLMTLNKLDLNVKRVALIDERHPETATVVLRDLNVKNPSPISMGGPNAETQPPVKIDVTGGLTPVASKFAVNLESSPFATEPVATVVVDASGIRRSALTELLPNLTGTIDGAKMDDGRFHAAVNAHAKFNRRGVRDFDLSHGFDLDVQAKEIGFREGVDGPVLAGVDAIQADSIHVTPKDRKVHVKSLELTKPIALITRQTDGIHALGFIIPLPTAGSPTTAPSASPTAEVATAKPASTTRPTADDPAAGEVRIDRLLISGAIRIEDHAVDPPLIVPVNSLDVEVRDLSTTALKEDRPIRFSAVVAADKVSLPVMAKKGAAPTTQKVEDRELFSQVTASGNISLYPTLRGYTKTSVSGFELASLKGEAAALGVDLSGGVFDADINARFRDEGSLDLRAKFVATDLKLTEPSNGPIQTKLGLSAPLDAVIGLVEDPDGGITIPLNVPVEKGKVSTGDIVGAGVGALSSILATAITSAPMKAVGGVGDLVGMGDLNPLGGNKKQTGPHIVTIAFAPGDATLSPADQQQIDQLVTLMRKDKNSQATIRSELGGSDLSLASERANPPPPDCLALASDLRATRATLADQRANLAARATGELGSSSQFAPATLQQLRDIDARIARTDDAMDKLYDLLRPGADRQATRRTRSASIQVADERVGTVLDALMNPKIPNVTERVTATAATFNPSETEQEGKITITVVQKKRQKK